MGREELETVIAYHDATKHHPHRYARSLGYLDWDTQPDPFRRFAGAELVRLNIPQADPTPPYEAIYVRGAVPPAPLDFDSVSLLFYLSLAISAWKQAGPSRWALRCNPSSGNLHPTEGYAILPAMAGLGADAGVYHYASREHGLERRARLEPATWQALIGAFPATTFLVGLSSVYWRETWKYGERAFRYCQHDAGHALAALRLAAAALGWQMAVLEELSDADVARLLGLDRTSDFPEAEPEHPDLVAVIHSATAPDKPSSAVRAQGTPTGVADREMSGLGCPALRRPHLFDPLPLDPAAIAAVAAGEWHGRANRLSTDHVEWGIIEEVAVATRKPSTQRPPRALAAESRDRKEPLAAQVGRSLRVAAPPPSGDAHTGPSAMQIIRQRRSAVAFDGRTSITAQTFYHMLGRVMPNESPGAAEAGHTGTPSPIPFDAVTWRPRIDLLLFVHLVGGLPPGLYVLARDPARVEPLKADMNPEFEWSRPPECPPGLPLYFLLQADCRRAAAQLSLGQEIAGMSAFSLGMLADFEDALAEAGSWYYRNLYWEAGMVGQVLYLEAEAAGLRSTGIGAYFDDLVHEVAGLRGRAFQSLYHFTVGGPVEDTRLTTLPSYPPPAHEAI